MAFIASVCLQLLILKHMYLHLLGNLELLDLTGNNLDSQTILGLAEIQRNGKPALIFSSLPAAADAPYDDDP